MPFSFDFDNDERIVIVKGAGEITIPKCASAMSSLALNPEYQPGYGVLIDLQEAELKFSDLHLRRSENFIKNLKDSYQGRVAILLKGKQFNLGKTVNLISHSLGMKTGLFVDKASTMAYVKADSK